MSANPIINCSNIYQLSEFVTHMVPKIWCGAPLLSNRQSNNFKLFCQNIFKSTQISTPCILVALFYICKLRYKYPIIKASIGSEVRLFTTALVLANKFLDDNTFTNKTWSEVSSVPLHELNIMEMEFLSALQYNTRVHDTQFFTWASQCQHWMTQLLARPVIIPTTPSVRTKRRNHPYYHPRQFQPKPVMSMLSWSSSSSFSIPSYPAAASVATAAAATAMNVNFIPRVSPH